jgi:hypothetical protein
LTAGLIVAAAQAGAGEKDQYTLFNPTPVDKMRAFNTDRPTKSNVPYTVDAGHFQYEGDIFIYSYDNTTTPDTNIAAWVVGNPTFKLGLLNNVDFEVNFSAYNSIRAMTVSTGASTTTIGFGDVFTRFKWNLFGNEGDGPALALIPYAKWPTAPQGIGNRFVEGGLITPLAIPLPGGFTTIVMGEMDVVKNPFDNNYHVNFPALINVNRQIFENVTVMPRSTPTGRRTATCATSTRSISRWRGRRGLTSSSMSASISAWCRRRFRTRSTWASRSASDQKRMTRSAAATNWVNLVPCWKAGLSRAYW